MKIIGVVCEYNPFHLGHWKQFAAIREAFGPDCAIVCLMSGNFVQRGQPAIFDKALRTQAALTAGADLVLELPAGYALSSAEGFAAGAVEILGKFCDRLCFGAESGTAESLTETAEILLSPEFPEALQQELRKGLSFPAARALALEKMGADAAPVTSPNDILGTEYCKAILAQGSGMRPFVIRRQGDYHASAADRENPSATALRALALEGKDFTAFLPEGCRDLFLSAPRHCLAFGERAVLARVRAMTEAEFEALPYGSEGLWRKFMHACREKATVEEILTAVKSKRYTRSRLDRMLLCAFLGLNAQYFTEPRPYVRVLGFREAGAAVLKKARETGYFPHIGEKTGLPEERTEERLDDLYGLFREKEPGAAGAAGKRRVCII